MHHHTENGSSLFSLLSSILLSSSLSSPSSLNVFLSVSVSVWCGGRVVVVGCGVVCGVWCVTRWKPRVCRHHAHMCFQHVRVVPAYTGTF